LAVSSSRPSPVSSSGVLVVLIKDFNIISQFTRKHELFMSILVHDGKQKKCISTLLTIDLQNFLTIFLTFLDFKKIIFNEIWTAVSMWKHYSKWRLANSTMSGLHKYNVMTNARLVLSTI
jgi:hypothetical protein